MEDTRLLWDEGGMTVTKQEMAIIHDALVIGWAYAKADYEIALDDYGAEDELTKGRKQNYDAFKSALTIINDELGIVPGKEL